ncbi:ABC transporter ATP-binding protein [Spirosoma aureum]|uniref:ABC transporter ATP-binding protein n=1 Tax=Spirosoma aureum TaxID=2692134 RepID=A0A6G9AN92_9BACT|nr:ABC transporter ATP-binding protein [Spirosoma aureum]QIP13927.1 ABC transporter ATP-binding protein [Spirosoma aureum]
MKKTLQDYLYSLVKSNKVKLLSSVVITLFSGLTRGGSFILLLPLLNLAGITGNPDQNSRAFKLTKIIWDMLGISFTIYTCLIIYVLLVLIHACLGYMKNIIDVTVVQEYKQNLRNELFSAVINAEWGFIKSAKNTHIFNNIINEINNIGYSVNLVISSFSTFTLFFFYLSTSLYVSIKMTVIASLCIVPLLLVQRKLNNNAYKSGLAMYTRHESLFNAVLEFINSFKMAKSYTFQDRYETEFRKITQQTVKDEYIFAKISAGTSILYEVGSAIIVSIILILAIKVVHMPVVDLLLMIYIASKLLPTISSLIRVLQYTLNTLPSYEGVINLLHDSQKNQEKNDDKLPVNEFPKKFIKFSEISFRYDEEKPILNNFSYEIEVNKTTSILGASGRGKTTLVELLLGLLKPHSGKILLDNKDLNDVNLTDWRNMSAYIPQECFLFNATIRENLLWVKPEANEAELQEVLKLVAGEFVFRLPNGLDTNVGDQGIRLSGGERQRIALARALLRNPKILILDEATNALDISNELIIKKAIDNLKGKMTILIIAHNQYLHEGADETVDLEAVPSILYPE